MERDKGPDRPLSFVIAKWYGYVFTLFYVLYGGVKIVLGVMDHNYEDFSKSVIFLLVGVVLAVVVFAYRDLKTWGWYGMVAVTGLTLIGSIIRVQDVSYLALTLLSGAALVLLLMPPTRECVFKGH